MRKVFRKLGRRFLRSRSLIVSILAVGFFVNVPYAAEEMPDDLIAKLEEIRKERGVERVILQSTPAGLKLYERMGFREVARVAVYSS